MAALRRAGALTKICFSGRADGSPNGALFVIVLGKRAVRAFARDSDRLIAVLINEQSSNQPYFEPVGVHPQDNALFAALGAIFGTSF